VPAAVPAVSIIQLIVNVGVPRIDGSRAEILAALSPLKDSGVVSVDDWARLTRQLGLA